MNPGQGLMDLGHGALCMGHGEKGNGPGAISLRGGVWGNEPGARDNGPGAKIAKGPWQNNNNYSRLRPEIFMQYSTFKNMICKLDLCLKSG